MYQCTIYLAPGDYHRFHSPADWKPEIRRHFQGELLSVNPKIAQWLPGLFCLNERALYMGEWEHGFFSFTAVGKILLQLFNPKRNNLSSSINFNRFSSLRFAGATNVGSVDVYIDEKLKTNRWSGFGIGRLNQSNEFDEVQLPITKLNKGELLGQFNMGSTVVLIFEAPKTFK